MLCHSFSQVHPLTRSFSHGGRNRDTTPEASSGSSSSAANPTCSSVDEAGPSQPVAVKDLRVGEQEDSEVLTALRPGLTALLKGLRAAVGNRTQPLCQAKLNS